MNLGQGTEATLFVDIIFWTLAICTIIAALAVVHLKDVFRSALCLVVSFLGVAGLFVLLRAEFLAAVQLLIYVGAISVLIIFAILMTRDVEDANYPNSLRAPAMLICGLFFVVATYVGLSTEWGVVGHLPANGPPMTAISEVFSNTIPSMAKLLMREYVLAFEVASVLLLAAIIGALALVRER